MWGRYNLTAYIKQIKVKNNVCQHNQITQKQNGLASDPPPSSLPYGIFQPTPPTPILVISFHWYSKPSLSTTPEALHHDAVSGHGGFQFSLTHLLKQTHTVKLIGVPGVGIHHTWTTIPWDPWWSLYGISAYIWLILMENVGESTLYGSCGRVYIHKYVYIYIYMYVYVKIQNHWFIAAQIRCIILDLYSIG